MSYRQDPDRRQTDRRVRNDPAYTGPERRLAERRKPAKEPRSKLGLIIGAIAAFVVADTALWNGQYRHVVISSFLSETEQVRDWSAHVWDMG